MSRSPHREPFATNSRALNLAPVLAHQPPARRPCALRSRGAIDGNTVFLYQHLLGCALLVPLALVFDDSECLAGAAAWPAAQAGMASAAGFFMYNRLSLSVLPLLNAVAHSVCNSLRRAVTIGFSATVFALPLNALTAAGEREPACVPCAPTAGLFTSFLRTRQSAASLPPVLLPQRTHLLPHSRSLRSARNGPEV